VTDRDRAAAFQRETQARTAGRIERHPWGELVVTSALPRVWDANFAVVTDWDDDVDALRDTLEEAQAAAGFDHRRTVVPDQGLAERLLPGFDRGWEYSSRYVLMAQRGEPDRAADRAIEVVEASDAEWAAGRTAMIATQPYGEDADLALQLIELDRRLARTIETRHLAAIVAGTVASYAALYLGEGVAQVEDVATLPPFRGRGLARAVVLHAVAEARRAGSDLVFLVADADDWPSELYGRLGFEPIGLEHVFGRAGRQHSRA